MTGDESNARKTELFKARQNFEHRIFIVHVDKVGFNDLIKCINENSGQAEPLNHVDICR